MEGYDQDRNLDGVDPSTIDLDMLGQTQSLHQIISQNNAQLMRRRAFESEFPQNTQDHTRRASMHEFGSSANTDIANFQFDPNPNDPNASVAMPISGVPTTDMAFQQKPLDPHRGRPHEDLSLDTRFSQMNARFGDMSAATTYSPAIMSNEPSPAYIPQALDSRADYDTMSQNTNPIGLGANHPISGPLYTASPIAPSFPVSYLPPNIGIGNNQRHASVDGMNDMIPTTMSQNYPQPQNSAQIQGAISHSMPTASAPASTMPSPLHTQRAQARRQSLGMPSRIQAQRKLAL